MRTLALLLALIAFPEHPAQQGGTGSDGPSTKDCLNYIGSASGIAADYSARPFSRARLQEVSGIEDKLIQCSNRSGADAKMLYSLFDAEVRLGGVRQVWLISRPATENR
jgi:hypothetical protein